MPFSINLRNSHFWQFSVNEDDLSALHEKVNEAGRNANLTPAEKEEMLSQVMGTWGQIKNFFFW
jgi:hypothetical protein